MSKTVQKVKLRFETGPRHEGEGSHCDWYEDLALVGIPEDGSENIVFFRGNWELAGILDWLHECERNIRQNPPPITQASGETLGQTLARAYDAVTDDLPGDVFDLAIASVSAYNQTHNIAIGAVGMADFPNIMIGRSGSGHEIANWIDDIAHDTAWRYLFDIDDFYRNLPVEDEQ
ncbi:hypothetical protein [Gordonia jacobaea]|uniref:hypothetical protein n=1 Tax=Gordonia jacobaea TaxID=122202 RepID=UPI003D723E27